MAAQIPVDTSVKVQHPWSVTWVANKVAMSLARLKFVPLFTKTMPNADPFLEGVTKEDFPVQTKNWGTLKCRSYASAKVVESLKRGEKVGLHFNFHASGFIFHSVGMDRYFLERTALALDVLVIDVDYPKAPEEAFPAPIHSSVEVLDAVLSQSSKYDTSRVSISGFSSGGAVALATSNILGPERISSVTAFFPMIDFEKPYTVDMAEVKHPEAVEPHLTAKMAECYVAPGTDPKSPHLTLRYADTERYPRYVTVLCANGDSFYPSCKELVDLISAKRDADTASFVKIENQGHNFDKTCGKDEHRVKVREETYDKVIATIKHAWAPEATAASAAAAAA